MLWKSSVHLSCQEMFPIVFDGWLKVVDEVIQDVDDLFEAGGMTPFPCQKGQGTPELRGHLFEQCVLSLGVSLAGHPRWRCGLGFEGGAGGSQVGNLLGTVREVESRVQMWTLLAVSFDAVVAFVEHSHGDTFCLLSLMLFLTYRTVFNGWQTGLISRAMRVRNLSGGEGFASCMLYVLLAGVPRVWQDGMC